MSHARGQPGTSPVLERRAVFDQVAALYAEARPGYPEQLVDDAIFLSGIPPGGAILEIGCGPGTATLPFARRGYTMLGLDIGAELARLAAETCRAYPDVRIQNVSFEAWPLQGEAFDLVLSAEAFHWVVPEVRFVKAAAALKRGGALALFWNGHPRLQPALFQAIEGVYAQRVPQLLAEHREPPEELERRTVEAIERSGLFGAVDLRRYRWRQDYTAEGYVKLVCTYSVVQSLPEQVRRRMQQEIRTLIEQHGGTVKAEYVSRLYVAPVL